MWIRQDGPIVRVLSPAKLNLFLEILAKRPDGYHEIETLIIAVNHFDSLTFVATENSSIHLRCRGAVGLDSRRGLNRPGGAPVSAFEGLPTEQDNLAHRALRLLQTQSGCRQGGQATLVKRIPPASGLGGGSSNAAAALLAANRAWKLGWTQAQLAELATELGSDVPFFLTQPTARGATMAICRGRGEQVRPCHGPAGAHFVVVRPAVGLSTAEVYQHCQPTAQPRPVENFFNAFAGGDYQAAARAMTNGLQPAAAELSPAVKRLADQFQRLGPIAHQLSGSGSAYFGWFPGRKAAACAAGRFRAMGYPYVWRVESI